MSPSAIAVPIRHRTWPRFLSGLVQRAVAQLKQRMRHARWRAEFAGVDERTLHDIGISRDEIDSLWAEAEGLAPLTRLQIRGTGRHGGCDADQ